jgi:hypothetical protein
MISLVSKRLHNGNSSSNQQQPQTECSNPKRAFPPGNWPNHSDPARIPFARTAHLWQNSPMGNKDRGKKETKKAPKPKPKPEPGRRVEIFTPAPPK